MNPIVNAFNPARRLALNLWIGFAVAMVLLLAVIGLGVHQMKVINTKLERIVDVYNVKSRLASHMRDTLRDRAIVMHDIVVSIDPWEKEDLFEKFLVFGEQYAKDRLRLVDLLETQEEKDLMEKLDRITDTNQPIMYQVVESAREENNYGALTLLQETAIPLQNKLVAALDDLSRLQREATDKAAKQTVSDYQHTRSLMLVMGTMATFLAMVIAWLVSRRVSTQTQLLDGEKVKFQTLFESNSDAVVILDDRGFTDCNSATLRMFGMRSVDEFLATPIPALGTPKQGPQAEDAAPYAMHMIELARREGHAFMEWQGRRTNGTLFPAEIALHAMELGDRPVIQAIMRDISDRKQVEQAMADARDAALSAARTKSEFVANVSHEIRTPLHGIVGMTDLLLKTHLHSAEQREYALTLKQSAGSLLNVINDLLDFSKIEAGKLKLEQVPFDLRSLLDEINNLYRPRALEKGLTLQLDGLDSLQCCVLGDPHRLRQILLNLVDNAFKFTQQGGVRIQVVSPHENQYRISVTDTGIGIAPENMAHLFEAFSQADSSTTRRFGGTGLGLAISRQLAEMMGGTIEVQSPPEALPSGTCFTLGLPLLSVSGKLQVAKEASPKSFHGRALIVEDNPVNQKVLYYQLSALGLQVEVDESGNGALNRMQQDLNWNIIFMDWQMPGMDGFATTQAIRAMPAANLIPIVALTANATPGFRETCLKAGMDDYLSKPYSEDALTSILNRWLRVGQDAAVQQASQTGRAAEESTSDTQPPLSVDRLSARMGGDTAILDDMLRVFVETTEVLLLDLNAALESQDFALAGKRCHSLRGAAAAVLADPLLHQAQQLDDAITRKDMDASQALLEDVEAEFIRIRHFFQFRQPAGI
jgi:PAS domain S-box-containing protein